MSNNNTAPSGSVDQAMNAVLEAERNAEQAITDCEQEAQEIIQAAHSRARRIAERSDERLTLAHMRTTARISGEISAQERQEKATRLDHGLYQFDATALAEIVEAVAIDLTESSSAPAAKEES